MVPVRSCTNWLSPDIADEDIRLENRDGVFNLGGARLDLLTDATNVRREADRITMILSASARLSFGSTRVAAGWRRQGCVRDERRTGAHQRWPLRPVLVGATINAVQIGAGSPIESGNRGGAPAAQRRGSGLAGTPSDLPRHRTGHRRQEGCGEFLWRDRRGNQRTARGGKRRDSLEECWPARPCETASGHAFDTRRGAQLGRPPADGVACRVDPAQRSNNGRPSDGIYSRLTACGRPPLLTPEPHRRVIDAMRLACARVI